MWGEILIHMLEEVDFKFRLAHSALGNTLLPENMNLTFRRCQWINSVTRLEMSKPGCFFFVCLFVVLFFCNKVSTAHTLFYLFIVILSFFGKVMIQKNNILHLIQPQRSATAGKFMLQLIFTGSFHTCHSRLQIQISPYLNFYLHTQAYCTHNNLCVACSKHS